MPPLEDTNPCNLHQPIQLPQGWSSQSLPLYAPGSTLRHPALICKSLFLAQWICGIYTGMVRQALQKKYHLKDAPCNPCMVHCILHWCALLQEHREMRNRLSDSFGADTTSIEPPLGQEMSSDNSSSVLSSSMDGNRTSLELQPMYIM